MNTFNFASTIKDVQNRIVASSIKQTSNLELLKSEEAIRDLIKSYTDRFRAAEGMLTDASRYIAQSKTLINVNEFNKLFESLYIDLTSLYNELENVDKVLSLNLDRNKNYFLIIKKRIRELWQRLRLARLNIYDVNPADESFYESFYSNINIARTTSVVVDKKLGFVYLQPVVSKIHNHSYEIKKITTAVYPVENEEAGVVFTTSPLNSLSGNYSNTGTRDMLENGLWKEEVVCSDVPDMILNIGSIDNPIYRNYRGIVGIVDIEYTYSVEINRIDFDIFGEKKLSVDAILYKTNISGDWNFVQQESETESETEVSGLYYSTLRGEGFDVLGFPNVDPVSVKVLRLVFNQKNFSFINSPDTNSVNLSNQIDKDLSERRYDVLKFNASLEEELTAPVNEENKSIYSKVLQAIESTRNIEDILIKINDILVPELKSITVDFGKTAKFELGLWSIEPKYEEYASSFGNFETKPFSISDRHLIGAALTTKQFAPGSSTINWYISTGGKNIPIVESEKTFRKEPLIKFDVSKYTGLRDWPGTFCLLDFPINAIDAYKMGIFQDGQLNESVASSIVFLNSRLIYLPTVTNFTADKFVIRYPVALYDCCNLYVLQPGTDSNINNDLIFSLCSSRREALDLFIDTVTYNIGGESKKLKEGFTINNALSTLEEARTWFGIDFTKCIFIDSAFAGQLGGYTGTLFDEVLSIGITKYNTTQEDITNYLSGEIAGSSDLNLIGTIPNLVPLAAQRML